MFEVGVAYARYTQSQVLQFTLARLEEQLGARVLRRSLTVWQEHCSECAMPSCYSACTFYRPRLDYKCQRLDGGVRVIPALDHIAVPMALKFGRWARLLGYGPAGLLNIKRARRSETRVFALARFAERIPASRGIAAPVRRRFTNILSQPRSWGDVDLKRLFLVVECINPSAASVPVVFSAGMVAEEGQGGPETFRSTLVLGCGYSVHRIPVQDFIHRETLGERFFMQIAPAGPDDHPELLFGLLDVAELSAAPGAELQSVATVARSAVGAAPQTAQSPHKLKCVVWDLDQTLWSGILVEDGVESLELNEQAVEVVRALDAKGVLQSVVSKNDPEDALGALRKFGLQEYFLFPQISWQPKSEGIRRLRDKLNIGLDTFAFVDDQAFERAEVTAALPEVLTVDPVQLSEFAGSSRLDVPVTAESSQRRSMYRAEDMRELAKSGFGGGYEDFLKSCAMSVTIAAFAATDLDRVYELVQRTNQLNISTSRYTREELAQLGNGASQRKAFVVHAADRFGAYGLIGFVVFEPERSLILDLMFSCRVQGKLVDDAFMAWLAEGRLGREPGMLRARFRANKKNAPARQLLERLGFNAQTTEESFEIWVKASPGRALADIRRVVSVTAPELT